jgi:hypothetical protein
MLFAVFLFLAYLMLYALTRLEHSEHLRPTHFPQPARGTT